MTRFSTRILSGAAALALAATALTALPALADSGSGSVCVSDDAHESTCNYAIDHVARFTQPGDTATGTFDLVLDSDAIAHGHDDNGGPDRAPDSTLTATSPGWQQVSNNAGTWTGADTTVTYRADQAPFGPGDQVSYTSRIPYDGENYFAAAGSSYLFAGQVAPGDLHQFNSTTTTTFSDRPLAVRIHDALPGVTLTKVGTETTGGILMDPAATDQDAPGAEIAPADADHTGNVYYGGYRSGTSDASFQVTYEVPQPPAGTDPTLPAHTLAGTQITVAVVVDRDDPTKQESTCKVTSPTTNALAQCSVTQTGSNDGQSEAVVNVFSAS